MIEHHLCEQKEVRRYRTRHHMTLALVVDLLVVTVVVEVVTEAEVNYISNF